MPTYSIKYIDTTVSSTSTDPLPLVDTIDSPPPSGNYTTYKHNSKVALEVGTTSDTLAFSITAPAPAPVGDQTVAIALAITSTHKTVVQWSAPSSTIQLDVQSDMPSTELALQDAAHRPLVKLKGTVKMP
jgi:hypothetical protein